MIFVSFAKKGLEDSPAVVVDRLRSHWNRPGVHLILEGVSVQESDWEGRATADNVGEHFLIGLEGDSSSLGELRGVLEACHLGPATLWELSTVYEAVERAATSYLNAGEVETAMAIYQRFAEALPDSYEAQSNAGRFFLRLEQPWLARPYLSRARMLAPEVPEIAINYWTLLRMEQKTNEAAALWEEICRQYPNHPAVRSRTP